jgi:hypothetical protein
VDADVRKRRKLGSLGSLGVAVPARLVDVLVALGVTELVIVGVAEMRGVAVAVGVTVRVGKVEVGNGPRSALAVPMMAVLVASTSGSDSSCKPRALVLLKTSA